MTNKPPVEKLIHARISEKAYDALKKQAKLSKRSISAQAAYLLENLLTEDKENSK